VTRNGANHYERLGVAPSASLTEIRAAYRELARRYHPDANPAAGTGSAAAMTAVNEAWFVLSDSRRRAEYDASIAKPAPPRAPTTPRAPRAPASRPTTPGPPTAPDPAEPPRPSWWNEPLSDDPRLDVPITDGHVVRTFGVLVAVAAALALGAVTALFTYAILWSS
jgi:hypothetical protein